MNLRIKRRRFGQLVIAGATSVAVANFAKRTVAQQAQLILYGVRLSTTDPTEPDLINTTPAIEIVSLDVAAGAEFTPVVVASRTVGNKQARTDAADKAVYTQPRERLTGFTTLVDGTFIVPCTISFKKGDATRLIFFNRKSSQFKKGLKSSGFKRKNSTIESILATQDGKFICVISLNGGVPPFDLAVIDQQTGKINTGAELGLPELPPDQRFSNLVQLPDGSIYATNVDRDGAILVQLDLKNKAIVTGRGKIIKLAPLSFDNKLLQNDLLSLAASPSGQLFALADPKNEGANSLFTVDIKTGTMQLLRKFEVDKIAFAPV